MIGLSETPLLIIISVKGIFVVRFFLPSNLISSFKSLSTELTAKFINPSLTFCRSSFPKAFFSKIKFASSWNSLLADSMSWGVGLLFKLYFFIYASLASAISFSEDAIISGYKTSFT